MTINFTDSPADGATQVISGRTYTYNSAKNKWDTTATEVVGPTAKTYATVNDLPGTALTGDQAFVSGTNRLYIWNGSGWYNIALVNTTPTWTTQPDSSYILASDGTATTITIVATDPEGLPITYSIASDTSGNTATVTQNGNVFTITPSTNDANAGTFSLTFRASDGVNIASAISEFTLQFKVQNSNYTTALITSVGTNNQVNNTFVDSSTNSHTITATGNATQTTFSPYRHGGYSMRTTAGTSLNIPASTDNQFTGDFTIEGWVYSLNTGDKSLYVHGSYFAFNVNFGGGFNIYLNSGGPTFSPTDIVPAANEWNHVALVRSGSTVSVYLNGVASATTATNSATLGYNSIAYIGGLGTQAGGSINGYIADFRVVNGSAVYTSNFTPPTERLTAITNTSVLACHLPYIVDGSTNNKNLTSSGTITTEPFAPYVYETYSATDNGASIYFDGSSRVEAPDSTDWNQDTDFTIEAWFYPISIPSNYVHMFGQWQSGGGGNRNTQLTLDPNGRVFMTVNRSGTNYSTSLGTTLKINNWYHIAVTLNGTTLTVWVNGKNDGSTTVGGSTNNSAMGWAIGGEPGSGSYPFTGFIADTRVIKGTAVYTANFTPPTAPLTAITNTKLLLSGTAAGIIDKSQSTKGLTLNGDVKSSTTQTKYLSSSMYFDGTGDYIDLPDFVSDYGSKDFTIEVWIYPTAVGTRNNFGDFNSAGQNASSSLCFSFANDKANWYIQTTTANSIISTASISANAWTHIALVRNGSTITQYINGSSDGTLNVGSASINQSSIVYTLGTFGDYQANFYQGYMSDFRVTKGLARYTANFTPPTAALKG